MSKSHGYYWSYRVKKSFDYEAYGKIGLFKKIPKLTICDEKICFRVFNFQTFFEGLFSTPKNVIFYNEWKNSRNRRIFRIFFEKFGLPSINTRPHKNRKMSVLVIFLLGNSLVSCFLKYKRICKTRAHTEFHCSTEFRIESLLRSTEARALVLP